MQNSVYRAKKAQKRFFFIAGLSKITGPKNKKLRNSVSFLCLFMSNVKNPPPTQNLKNPKNYLKYS